MTVREWLETRTPRPPQALAARLHEVLGTVLERDVREAPDVMIAASERVVAQLLLNDPASRESALDLLVADSLVTYAFEAASVQPETIAALAGSAMQRIAALATSDA